MKTAQSLYQLYWNKLAIYFKPKPLTMLGLGFSSGMPFLLIFSTLSLWLKEAGIEKSTITMFSWAALGYSFKFIWSPLIDNLPLPLLSTKFGHRRAWLILAQILIIVAICIMAMTNPQNHDIITMAQAAVLLGFASATQDIVIDAYRIELAPEDSVLQTAMSATHVAGYRIALFISGAGSLFIAEKLGSTEGHYLYTAWQQTYFIMAIIMLGCLCFSFFISEPQNYRHRYNKNVGDYLYLLILFIITISIFLLCYQWIAKIPISVKHSAFTTFLIHSLTFTIATIVALFIAWLLIKMKLIPKHIVQQTWVSPIVDFFNRYHKNALLLLLLIGFYRVSDIVAGAISNVFYADMGFSKEEIAKAVKAFGIFATIFGGFIAGIFAQKQPIMRLMMIGAILAAITNLLFCLFAYIGHNPYFLYIAVGLDNLAAGFATTIFVAFLSALTNIQFTAVQYALFSSLMTLFPKVLGGYSGTIVEAYGYNHFFIFTTLLTLPIVLLIWRISRSRCFTKPDTNY